jgi:hypothetical protein
MEFLGTLDKLDVKGLELKKEWKDYKKTRPKKLPCAS